MRHRSTRTAVSCILHWRVTRDRRTFRMKNAPFPRVMYRYRVAGPTIFFNVCIFQRFWCYCPRDLRPDSGSVLFESHRASYHSRALIARVNQGDAIKVHVAHYTQRKNSKKMMQALWKTVFFFVHIMYKVN